MGKSWRKGWDSCPKSLIFKATIIDFSQYSSLFCNYLQKSGYDRLLTLLLTVSLTVHLRIYLSASKICIGGASRNGAFKYAGCYRNIAAKNAATAKIGSPPIHAIIITNDSARSRSTGKSVRRRAKNAGTPSRPTETTGAARKKWNGSGCGARRIRFIGNEPNAGNELRYKIS